MEWNKEGLKAEVLGYENNHNINWSGLAFKCNLCNNEGHIAKNGGQIVKEYLISQEVNVTRFQTKRK